MSVAEDEQVLISRAVGGDRVALQQLLLRQAGRLSRHIAARLPVAQQDAFDVDDVLQQTFLHAYRGIRQLERPAPHSFRAWLRTIADRQLHNAVQAQRCQKRGRNRHRVGQGTSGSQGSMCQLVELLSGREHTPSRSVARREAVRAIQVGIAGLPNDQREAVRIHFLEGRSLAETAHVMGRSSAAVRGLLHRAEAASNRFGKGLAMVEQAVTV